MVSEEFLGVLLKYFKIHPFIGNNQSRLTVFNMDMQNQLLDLVNRHSHILSHRKGCFDLI